jgi:hypothetical protein
VVLPEVDLQGIVVNVVLRLTPLVLSIAYMASLVLISTMGVELVIPVETLPAEAALGVAFESTLIDCPGVVVAKLLVGFELAGCE